jgi:hypothetical protein
VSNAPAAVSWEERLANEADQWLAASEQAALDEESRARLGAAIAEHEKEYAIATTEALESLVGAEIDLINDLRRTVELDEVDREYNFADAQVIGVEHFIHHSLLWSALVQVYAQPIRMAAVLNEHARARVLLEHSDHVRPTPAVAQRGRRRHRRFVGSEEQRSGYVPRVIRPLAALEQSDEDEDDDAPAHDSEAIGDHAVRRLRPEEQREAARREADASVDDATNEQRAANDMAHPPPAKRNRCSRCNQPGHNVRRCTQPARQNTSRAAQQ